MSEQFFNSLGLVRSKDCQHVKKPRPLTLQVNLKPQQFRDNVPWTPKTPCSMLSPLTPKRKKLEWSCSASGAEFDSSSPSQSGPEIDFDNDPSLALMMIDVTSNLGKRLSNTLSLLVNLHSCTVTTEYDKYCNRGEMPQDPNLRILRTLEARSLPAYRKRYCHRYVDRAYFFKPSEKIERKKTLLAGGLNKASRRLYGRMKRCSLVLEKLDNATLEPILCDPTDIVLQMLLDVSQPVVILPKLKLHVKEPRETPQEIAAVHPSQRTPPAGNANNNVVERSENEKYLPTMVLEYSQGDSDRQLVLECPNASTEKDVVTTTAVQPNASEQLAEAKAPIKLSLLTEPKISVEGVEGIPPTQLIPSANSAPPAKQTMPSLPKQSIKPCTSTSQKKEPVPQNVAAHHKKLRRPAVVTPLTGKKYSSHRKSKRRHKKPRRLIDIM